MRVLDLGCGLNKTNYENAVVVGVDIGARMEPDLVWDLNVTPWPFDDCEFDCLVCHDILEHLDDLTLTMREIHRVAKSGASVHIRVPFFASADMFTDPTHRRFFSARTLDYYCGGFGRQAHFSDKLFRKVNTSIEFWSIPRLGGLQPQRLLGLGILANRLTKFYECFLAWMMPAQYIEYDLEVLKADSPGERCAGTGDEQADPTPAIALDPNIPGDDGTCRPCQ